MKVLLEILIAINIIWLLGNLYYDFFVNSRHKYNLNIYKKAFKMVLDGNVDACVMDKEAADTIKYKVGKLTK